MVIRINFSENINVTNSNETAGTSQSSGSVSIFNFEPEVSIEGDVLITSKNPTNPTNNVDTSWLKKYANYKPRNTAKYNKIKKFVENYTKEKGNRSANIKEITNMICKLSDDYGIDPEIIATILAHETGGFVFTADVMSRRTNYKGVGQVDRDVVDCLYADENYKYDKKYPTKRDAALSYDTRHWKQDAQRIYQIKAKYPTSSALWAAIQKDVSLGLEVGIIAYKMKLHGANGDTHKALYNYCHGQYTLAKNNTAQNKYNIPLPSYKLT